MPSDFARKKKNFRNSKAWKTFRHNMNVKDKGKDYITGSRLLKGYELHHLDLNPEHYQNLDEENFVSVNKMTHTVIHWIYRYYEKDEKIMERIREVLDKMIEINKEV